eukprot:TRINITY_DN11274_c0_g1_i4.p1 TRINITY_DN11274_c0_g1~~TRINITY_DN11274_c0_g1_i4.p1  ORF type:complete len:204 (+),score=6.70 TRINITY_DN11274_c0_g1_i4:77-613(+)
MADEIGSLFNPCGGFPCSVDGSSNQCACQPPFVQATNADGSRTCAYVDVCGATNGNPCAVGTCVNDGKGSYSCVCPPGFRQGTTVDGTLSCAPGYSGGVYTVLSSNIMCSDIYPMYGLTLAQFKAQNKYLQPPLDCSSPVPIGADVNVTTSLPSCSVFYTTANVCRHLCIHRHQLCYG